MTDQPKNRAEAKAQAKALQAQRAEAGSPIGYMQALEQIAQQHGYRSWNALQAALPERGWSVGQRVTGRYLGQPFSATILRSQSPQPGWHQLVLDLDEPVDVVRFDSFSNHRRRLRLLIGPKGMTRERTSDGQPHAVLDN